MAPAVARAQDYPSKPVRVVVPYPAGDGTDLVARLVDHGRDRCPRGRPVGLVLDARAARPAAGESPQAFAQRITRELATWKEIARAAGIEPE